MTYRSIFPLCLVSGADPAHSNYEAVTVGGLTPELLGSAFCVGQDATDWYFITSRHVFVGDEADYVKQVNRMFVGARAKTPTGAPFFYLPVVYKIDFGSPTPDPRDENELVLFKCKRNVEADVVPLPMSTVVAKLEAEITLYGVLDIRGYFEEGMLTTFSGVVSGFHHFLNRNSMTAAPAYIVAAEMPHGLSGGCCMIDGVAVGVNVSGFSETMRCTVEAVLAVLTLPFPNVFSWVGTPMAAPAIYAPFVVSRVPGADVVRIPFSACDYPLTKEVLPSNPMALRDWAADLIVKFRAGGLWLEDFNLVGVDRELALGYLLGELLVFYKNTGTKVPLTVTPLAAVYP